MSATTILLILIILGLICAFFLKRDIDSQMAQMIKEYREAFPGGCPICGFARYRHREHGKPFDPPHHKCPEAHRPIEERKINAPLTKPSALTVKEAQDKRVCRFCKLEDTQGPGLPFVLNFGKEYSHKACLQENTY